jgi:hypothetical protein
LKPQISKEEEEEFALLCLESEYVEELIPIFTKGTKWDRILFRS